MRRVSTCVFPVPGPAITMTEPSTVSTAFFWEGFNCLYNFLNSKVTTGIKHYTTRDELIKVGEPNSTSKCMEVYL